MKYCNLGLVYFKIMKNWDISMHSKSTYSEESVQLIVFKLGTEEFALEITQVIEIVRLTAHNVIQVPNVPNFIEGIMNLRGEILVVMDLRKRFNIFGASSSKGGHILIVDASLFKVGLIIDAVSQTLRLPTKSIEPVPIDLQSQSVSKEYLLGVGKVSEKRLIILIDLIKIFSDTELEELDEIYNADYKLKQIINDKRVRETTVSLKASREVISTREKLERTRLLNLETMKQQAIVEERGTIQELAMLELMNEMNIQSKYMENHQSQVPPEIEPFEVKKPKSLELEIIPKTEIITKSVVKSTIKPNQTVIMQSQSDIKEIIKILNKWTKKKLVAFVRANRPDLLNSKIKKAGVIKIVTKNLLKELSAHEKKN